MTNRLRIRAGLCGLVASLILSAWLGAAGDLRAGELQAAVGPKGLTALNWAGADLLKRGTPEVRFVILEQQSEGKTAGKEALVAEGPMTAYSFEKIMGDKPEVRAGADAGADESLVYDYAWGSVSFAYKARPDRLELTTTIQNDSDRTIAMFARQLQGEDGLAPRTVLGFQRRDEDAVWPPVAEAPARAPQQV